MNRARRLSLAIGCLVIATLAVFGVSSGAPAAASAPIRPADVNDFLIDSFDAVYELGRDASGRSTLTTTERIVAIFPEHDQNRGLIRDLVRVYNGHETDLTITAVTDERGIPRDYETEKYGDFLAVIMAVPEGQFVHGAQTYVITYTQRDVTRQFDDLDTDEFYWDVNGTGWTQPFGRVSARIELAEELIPALTGAMACYYGGFGAGDLCEIERRGAAISAAVHDLRSGQNVTFAIAFIAGTFTDRPAPFLARTGVLFWGGVASFGAGLGYILLRLRKDRRGDRTGDAIIAQFEPPENMPVALSAALLGTPKKAMTATLLDLAVRGRVQLLRDEEHDRYGVQVLEDARFTDPIEQMLATRLFGTWRTPVPASDRLLWFETKRTRLGDAAAAVNSRAQSELANRQLQRKPNWKAFRTAAVLLALALALPLAHTIIGGDEFGTTLLIAVGLQVLLWGLIGLGFLVAGSRPLTRKGALLHDHLMGLKEFIRVAEADRIRMLQSVSGVEVDENFIVRVYERLLPYAVVFGYEKEWQAELARYYRESTPEWIAGSQGAFPAALSLSSFDRYVASSPSTVSTSSSSSSSFSSSSGGSSGGGFSGGGGGGGGGRGI